MRPEQTRQAQDEATKPTEHPPASLVQWEKVGREALRLNGRTPKTLRETVAECEALVILEAWLACDQNMTRVAELLAISRGRVRRVVTAWRESEREGGEECRP